MPAPARAAEVGACRRLPAARDRSPSDGAQSRACFDQGVVPNLVAGIHVESSWERTCSTGSFPARHGGLRLTARCLRSPYWPDSATIAEWSSIRLFSEIWAQADERTDPTPRPPVAAWPTVSALPMTTTHAPPSARTGGSGASPNDVCPCRAEDVGAPGVSHETLYATHTPMSAQDAGTATPATA